VNKAKMRHQRGRVRPTVRPADLASHPADRIAWMRRVRVLSEDASGSTAQVVCDHCDRAAPCPTEVYLHGQEGHDWGMCGGPDRCDVFERARYVREREVLA
jgi:hypothetical protein